MKKINYTVPRENGNYYISHSLEDIQGMMASDKEIVSWSHEKKEIEEKKAKAKVNLLNYLVKNKIVNNDLLNKSPLFLATGHQPSIAHTGIWIKYFLINELSNLIPNSIPINIIVDSDLYKDIYTPIPYQKEGLNIHHEPFLINEDEKTFEASQSPSKEQFDAYCTNIRGLLSSLGNKEYLECFDIFEFAGRNLIDRYRNLSDFLLVVKRRYESSLFLKNIDIKVSEISKLEDFAAFTYDLIMNIPVFLDSYNDAIDKYRLLFNIKNNAQPFPKLKKTDNLYELPFWFIEKQGQRVQLNAKICSNGDTFLVNSANEDILRLSRDKEAAVSKLMTEIEIRPKAVALTIFIRLFLTDLFIHGIGGGNYDVVTDEIIRQYYNITPPEYIVTSLSMYPDLGREHQINSPGEIAALIRRLKCNPEDFIYLNENHGIRNRLAELKKEKGEVLNYRPNSKKDNRSKYKQLSEINFALATLLSPVKEDLERRYKIALNHERALTFREYPYFLFAPKDVRDSIYHG